MEKQCWWIFPPSESITNTLINQPFLHKLFIHITQFSPHCVHVICVSRRLLVCVCVYVCISKLYLNQWTKSMNFLARSTNTKVKSRCVLYVLLTSVTYILCIGTKKLTRFIDNSKSTLSQRGNEKLINTTTTTTMMTSQMWRGKKIVSYENFPRNKKKTFFLSHELSCIHEYIKTQLN
jgi:hypothetical protein